jgi:hypothetical protein
MSFQYTYDASGKPVGVFIPINEWQELTAELGKAKIPLNKNNRSATYKSIKKGLQQVNEIKEGKIKSISMKQLLDEL